jgi:hypothetical protein
MGNSEAAAAYQPPALVVLGSVQQLTLGSVGSFLDNNGNGSHGTAKKNCNPRKGC